MKIPPNFSTQPLRRISASHWHRHLRGLLPGTDNTLTGRVAHDCGIFILHLCPLPDLNLTTSTEDAHTHGAEQVVRRVGVQVDTAIEDGCGILADGRGNEGLATGVVLDEVSNIVDNTGDGHKSLAVLGLLDKIVPVDDGELLKGKSPIEFGALLVKFLLLLLEAALLDFILAEGLEVGSKAELLPDPDAPLGRVVLIPLDGVSVVRWEFVVEVVISLAQSDECSDDMVAGAVAVVEGLLAEPVSQRVDTESSLLDDEDAENGGIDEATPPVAPAEAGHQSREDQSHEKNDLDEVGVLEDDNRILVEIGDIGTAGTLGVLLDDHPANVAVEQALSDGVGVLLSVGISVVSAVALGPPAGGTLHGTSTDGGEVDAKGEACLVAAMSPESMVASGDAETGVEVIWNRGQC